MCDFDSSPAFRKKIINRFKEIWGDDKVLQVATFSTLKPKAAIKKACKGLGVDDEDADYLASLVKIERGEPMPLKDVFRLPEARKILNEHPEIERTVYELEDVIIGCGTHAGGVCMYNEPYVHQLAMMRSPSGTEQTCFDLHDSEATGTTKFDVLTTTAMELVRKCITMLQDDGYIEAGKSYRETYEDIIGLNNIEELDEEMWEKIMRMPQVFEFETNIGIDCLKKIKPRNIEELTAANSLMRLIPAGWSELPIDRYIRYADENEFIKDATNAGLNEEEIKAIKEVCESERYMTISQETMMLLSMHKKVAAFTYKEANALRKSVAKKSEKAQEEAKKTFFEWCKKNGTRDVFANFVWNMFSAQFGYAFSCPHSLSYSYVALQELNLFHKYPEEYWPAAILNTEGISDEESSGAGVDYTKVTKVIYKMKEAGVNVEPPKINFADREFTVNADEHKIYYALSAIPLINDDDFELIMKKRPFKTMSDFVQRVSLTNSKMLNLIKAGCFGNPINAMRQYAKIVARNDMPEKFTMVHAKKFPDILPDKLKAVLLMTIDIKSDENFLGKSGSKKVYRLDDKYERFTDGLKYDTDYWHGGNNEICITGSAVDKAVKEEINQLKEYITTEQFMIDYFNALVDSKMDALCKGDMNDKVWEFATTSYYHGKNIYGRNIMKKYDLVGYDDMPEEAEYEIIEYSNGHTFKRYNLYSMPITVIGKNDTRHMVFGLTADDKVVSCKFSAGEYAYYKSKPSWFNRGDLLIMHGYRDGDQFRMKKYANSSWEHTVVKIEKINGDKLEIISSK